MVFPKYILGLFPAGNRKKIEKDAFCKEIETILGVDCKDISHYHEAFTLKGFPKSSTTRNYERLEFLGDSVLGSIISSHLFHKYPSADEGVLTQLKSKIVSRKNLNKLGENFEIVKLIRNSGNSVLGENIAGNLFEAFIGAIYLDLGYDACKKIVLEKLLTEKEIVRLENKIISYKSLLLEWSQKKKCAIRYETEQEIQGGKNTVFRCRVWLDDKNISNATESSKKKAEEKAAQRAFYILNKKQNILEAAKPYS